MLPYVKLSSQTKMKKPIYEDSPLSKREIAFFEYLSGPILLGGWHWLFHLDWYQSLFVAFIVYLMLIFLVQIVVELRFVLRKTRNLP